MTGRCPAKGSAAGFVFLYDSKKEQSPQTFNPIKSIFFMI